MATQQPQLSLGDALGAASTGRDDRVLTAAVRAVEAVQGEIPLGKILEIMHITTAALGDVDEKTMTEAVVRAIQAYL